MRPRRQPGSEDPRARRPKNPAPVAEAGFAEAREIAAGPEDGTTDPGDAEGYFLGSSFLASSFFSAGGTTHPVLMSRPGRASCSFMTPSGVTCVCQT